MLTGDVFVDASALIGVLDRRIYGQFIEHLGRCIYGGIWVGARSKIPNVKGFRKDVLDAIKAIEPPIVRWPGGNFSSAYHWEDGIGPRESRPRRFDIAWGAEEPNEFGTDEFVEWCRIVGTQPFIVVNAGNGTPEEAARWVEYCNSSGGTHYALLRRRYGHPEPYNVRLWGIGNELYGRWQVGFCVDGMECARRTLEFANEMRKVDPSIELVGVGCEDPEWNLSMVKVAGEYIDYLSVHTYIGGDRPYRELVATPMDIEDKLRGIYYLIECARRKWKVRRRIRIAFDEWNVWYPEAKPPLHEQVTRVKDAIFTALVLNALQRLCNEVAIACFAQTVNVLPLIMTRDDGAMFVNPQYLVFKLYAEGVRGSVVCATAIAPAYYSKSLGKYVCLLDVSAIISKTNDELDLFIVNRHEDEGFECKLHIRGFSPSLIEHNYIAGDSIDDMNSFDEPNRVSIERRRLKFSDGASIEVPPHSVNLMRLR